MVCISCGKELTKDNFRGIEDKWGKYCTDCDNTSENYEEELDKIKSKFEQLIKEVFYSVKDEEFEYLSCGINIKLYSDNEENESYMSITQNGIFIEEQSNCIIFPKTLNTIQNLACEIMANCDE